MFYYSASSYSRLRRAGCNLPAESTVRRWVSAYDLRPGFCECIFDKLQDKLLQLPAEERVCALKWDEMAIKRFEEYSKKLDVIEGLVDLGPLGRRFEPAKNVLVFCLDSLNAKNPWRQVLAYFLTGKGVTGEDIEALVRMSLDKIKIAKGDVRLVTCDQGAINQRCFARLNVSEQKPWFNHNGRTYLASFDFPHLIKRLLYQLRTYQHLYADGEMIVSYNDLVDTWKYDRLNTTSHLLSHISEAHISPSCFQTMNVKRAFQMLSHTYACAIKIAGSDPNGLKNNTWQKTVDYVEKMNKVIDSCNAYRLISRNPAKRPLSEKNPEIQKTLEDFVEWSSKWYATVDGKQKERAPCLKGLPLTLKAILNCYESLTEDFPGFELAVGLCNQDSVEHLFSKLRHRGGHNPNPTARMVRLSLRHIISTGFILTSEHGNVRCEETHSLLEPKTAVSVAFEETEHAAISILQQEDEEDLMGTEIQEDQEYIILRKTIEDIDGLHDVNKFQLGNVSLYERNSIVFFAGYIAMKIVTSNNCDQCRIAMMKTPMDVTNEDESYITFREYPNTDDDAPAVTKLTRPTTVFAEVVGLQLSVFNNVWKQYWTSSSVLNDIMEDCIRKTNKAFPEWFNKNNSCLEHRHIALQFLLRVKLYAKTRSNNNEARSTGFSNSRKMKNVMNL